MTAIVAALQSPIFLEEGICFLHLDADLFWHRGLVLLLQN